MLKLLRKIIFLSISRPLGSARYGSFILWSLLTWPLQACNKHHLLLIMTFFVDIWWSSFVVTITLHHLIDMNIDGLEDNSSSEDEEDVVRSNCQLLRQLETFVMILTVPYAHRAYSLQYLIALTDGIGCPPEWPWHVWFDTINVARYIRMSELE